MVLADTESFTRGKLELDALAQCLEEHREKGDRVVHCHGVFDLLHIGHIRHFEEAKKMGDILVVTVTPDQYVNKGPNRPAFNEQFRAEALRALSCIDYVSINRWPNAVNTIRLLKPDLYVKGPDYRDMDEDITGGIRLEKEALEEVGGELSFTEDVTFSSSSLLNQNFPIYSPEMHDFLQEFKENHSFEEIVGYLDEIRDLRVLLVGETIIDDYHYCRAMGKSGKEPILAVSFERQETFAGGILAVGNCVSGLSDHVNLLSFLGNRESHEDFIREQVAKGVNAQFLRMSEGPTIVKRRYVESYPFQKMFEVYVMGSDEGDPQDSTALCNQLEKILPDFDLVIVVDYGHGMMTPEVVELLSDQAPYLAVNTQINAGNHGFNTISKYKRADYICVSEHELRMDVRTRQRALEDIIPETAHRLNAKDILITRGKLGSYCYREDEGLFDIPAFTAQAVDRVGAGDAVLAITGLLAKNQVPIDALGLIGNAYGLQAVQNVGHRQTPDRTNLLKFIQHCMK
ncbi:MAG: cytidyltransferase [Waddliaceae bacterium]|nr:cytidyltransferase [Waddliaceae bacterium]